MTDRRSSTQNRAVPQLPDLFEDETPAPEPPGPRPRRAPRRIYLPQPVHMLRQTLPDLLVAIAAVIVLAIGPMSPLGIPVWTAGMLLPGILLFVLTDPDANPLWRRTSIVNLLTVGIIFPVLVVRQSIVHVPYLDRSNGTLWPPLLATLGLLVVLVGLALAVAILAHEDPEYAGVMFLPAAMLVPLFAGPLDATDFRTSVTGIAIIFFASAVLTVLASVLPGAYPALVAPLAIGIEILVLASTNNESLFPVGSGFASKFMFVIVVLAAVGLSIAVPTGSVWVREIRRIMRNRPRIGPIS